MALNFLQAFGGSQSAEGKRRARASGHHTGGRFHNLQPTRTIRPGSFWKMFCQLVSGSERRVPTRILPTVKRVLADYESNPAGAIGTTDIRPTCIRTTGIRTTWIGHSSALVEFDGIRILTDPIWSERSSPVPWFGPRRFFPPPLSLEDLPAVDAVLLSHDHYDHLDMRTIKQLAKRNFRFVMPLGVGAHLAAWGVPRENIVELNWYESLPLAGLEITLVPARHFSGRHLVGRDRTLWGAFVLASDRFKLFYSGDSGPSDSFPEIGARYGPFDLTLMQIGAYNENWPEIHMTPEEAVAAHIALQGKMFLPLHWGTFNLAIHSWNDPAKRLARAAQAMGVDFRIPRPGELVYSDPDPRPVNPAREIQEEWWAEE